MEVQQHILEVLPTNYNRYCGNCFESYMSFDNLKPTNEIILNLVEISPTDFESDKKENILMKIERETTRDSCMPF